jgi:thioredoxin
MILINHNTKSLIGIIILFVLLFVTNSLMAQEEIPDNIKDLIVKGTNALDSAKVPQDIENAYALFVKAAEIAPSYPDVHYFLGETLSLMQGNTGKAINELKKYLELYPEAPDKDKVNSEIEQLEEAIKLNKVSYLMGVSLMQLPDGIYVQRVSPNYYMFVTRMGNRLSTIKGIKVGDKIIAINGIDITGYSLQSVMKIFNDDTTSKGFRTIKAIRGGQTIGLIMPSHKNFVSTFIKDLREDDLDTIISTAKKPLVVFFVSDWCDSCQYYLHQGNYYKYKDEITYIYANIDEKNSLISEFNISRTPTVLMYKNGKLFDKIIGYNPDLLDEKTAELLK